MTSRKSFQKTHLQDTTEMPKFELANLSGRNSEDAVVYFPGQNYVMFGGIQFRLDRVLHEANEHWVGCVFLGDGLSNNNNKKIHFIERRPLSGQFIVHAVGLVFSTDDEEEGEAITTTASEEDEEDDATVVGWTLEKEKRLSSMRLTQAAILLKAVKRASESVNEIARLTRSFDRKMENEFPDGGGVKLGINNFIRKRKDAVSLDDMKKTLRMVENESIEIMHEELDIPHRLFRRSRQ